MTQNGEFPPRKFSSSDARALLALAALFAVTLAASWQRWTQPLLDHGREMNLPARILAGEQLYSDVQFIYGPFAPHFNAMLYGVFGIHLSVLKTGGTVCAVLILLMIYWLARQLLSVWESALTAGLVLVICALKSTANYIQPYAFAALYALVFALGSLVATVRYLHLRSDYRRLVGGIPAEAGTTCAVAGALAGLALISKPEIALAAVAAICAALAVECWSERRLLRRDALMFAAPAAVIFLATYGFILSRVPLRVLLEDNYVLFTTMPEQLIHFNRHISGLAGWPRSFWFSLAGVGVFTLWAGLCAVFGAIFSAGCHKGWRGVLITGSIVAAAGAVWREASIRLFGVPSDVTPFASAVFILPAVTGILARRVLSRTPRREDEPGPLQPPSDSTRDHILLCLTIFSFVSILRAVLNVTTTGPYTPFFLPAPIVVYLYLLFRVTPALLSKPLPVRANVRRAAMILIALLIAGMTINSSGRFRRMNAFAINSARGSFITVPEIGKPLEEAIRFAERRTGPGDYVLSLPVATTINFLADRLYPLREEIVHPGFLEGEKEQDAIERIKSRNTSLILIANLDASEFRDRAFGVDYNRRLMRWINDNYRLVARFDSPSSAGANWGDDAFFILAFERNP
jgi:hypothetical protein